MEPIPGRIFFVYIGGNSHGAWKAAFSNPGSIATAIKGVRSVIPPWALGLCEGIGVVICSGRLRDLFTHEALSAKEGQNVGEIFEDLLHRAG